MNKDTETKFEKTENLEDDYYDYNNDNNIMDVALGNIKDDPASIRSRPRRLKYWQLTLEDEDKIPKMPEKIIEEPNKELFNKLIESLREKKKEKNELIEKKLALIKEKRNEDKSKKYYDNNISNLIYQQKNELMKKKGELREKINTQNEINEPIRNTIKEYSENLKKFDRYHFSKKTREIRNQITQIKQQLSFSALTTQEEKKLIEKKQLLEEYIKPLKQLNDYKYSTKDHLKSTKSERKELNDLSSKIKEIKEHLKEIKQNKNNNTIMNEYEIEQIKSEIDDLRTDKKIIQNNINEEYDKFYQQKRDYEKQKELLNYINECQNKIKYLKKRNQKEKKIKEEKKKKNKGNKDNKDCQKNKDKEKSE